jgi:hypothetical protein
MSTAHEYPTRKVQGSDLDETMTLVGESGGLSSVYAEGRSVPVGLISVETEHGFLYLDPDEEFDVLDLP